MFAKAAGAAILLCWCVALLAGNQVVVARAFDFVRQPEPVFSVVAFSEHICVTEPSPRIEIVRRQVHKPSHHRPCLFVKVPPKRNFLARGNVDYLSFWFVGIGEILSSRFWNPHVSIMNHIVSWCRSIVLKKYEDRRCMFCFVYFEEHARNIYIRAKLDLDVLPRLPDSLNGPRERHTVQYQRDPNQDRPDHGHKDWPFQRINHLGSGSGHPFLSRQVPYRTIILTGVGLLFALIAGAGGAAILLPWDRNGRRNRWFGFGVLLAGTFCCGFFYSWAALGSPWAFWIDWPLGIGRNPAQQQERASYGYPSPSPHTSEDTQLWAVTPQGRECRASSENGNATVYSLGPRPARQLSVECRRLGGRDA